MTTWIIIGIVWLLVAAAFTIVMGVIHCGETRNLTKEKREKYNVETREEYVRQLNREVQ